MDKDKKLTPEQRIAALEASLEKVTDLEAQVSDLTDKTTALEGENADLKKDLEAAEKLVEEATSKKEEQPKEKAEEPKKEPEGTAELIAGPEPLTKEDIAAAVAEATASLTDKISDLEVKLTNSTKASEESAKTKQPGNADSIVETEEAGGVEGDRDGASDKDENPYATLFGEDKQIAQLNVENITYEEACERNDRYSLHLLSAMEHMHGTEAEFNKKNAA